MFSWMKSQGDILDETNGNMPIITPKGKKGFKLDQDTPTRKIADSVKNTLTKKIILSLNIGKIND